MRTEPAQCETGGPDTRDGDESCTSRSRLAIAEDGSSSPPAVPLIAAEEISGPRFPADVQGTEVC